MTESVKTAVLAGAALALAISAAVVEPEARVPAIMSDQGEAFYPNFTDAQAPRTIEVVDYDEATATALPLSLIHIFPSHQDQAITPSSRKDRSGLVHASREERHHWTPATPRAHTGTRRAPPGCRSR